MQINLDEALRYLGAPGADDALRSEMAALAEELQQHIQPRRMWRMFPVNALHLPGQTADTLLRDCQSACVMTVTLGAAFDAWLLRLKRRDMRRAVMLDALGSALVESACDEAEREIAARFPQMHLTDRFSPGYGDLPLTAQHTLLTLTDAPRTLGVTLTDSLLMTPIKSVTAVIGLADKPQMARIRGCEHCAMNPICPMRKAGTNCHV